MYSYNNNLSGWRNVPFNEIDTNALVEMILEIQRIIKTSTRADIEALINPNNPYYHQPSNKGWAILVKGLERSIFKTRTM